MKRWIISLILTSLIMVWAADFYWTEDFDTQLCIVFFTLGLMFSYTLVNYLAKFKIIEHNSRIDIVFVSAVAAMMFVPILKINHDEISVQENRTLAQYIPLVKDGKINFNYGKDFEVWFNDHFNQRDFFIDLNARLNLFLNRKLQGDTAMQGKENWLFTTRWHSVDMFQNKNLFTEKELQQVKENMLNLQNWTTKHGMKFYVLLIPDKERIYPEYYPDGFDKAGDLSKLEQVSSYLQQHTDITVINLYDALMQAKKKHTVFYKTGTHWNLRGAYAGYLDMMKVLKKDFPGLKILGEKDFDIQWKREADVDIASALGVDAYKTFPDEDLTYEVFTLKNPHAVQNYQMLNKDKRIELYSYKSSHIGNNRRAVFFADSQFLRMNWYVAESFAEMMHVYVGYGRNYDLPFMAEQIIAFKPNIFVFETGERFLNRLLDIEIPQN